MESLGLEG